MSTYKPPFYTNRFSRDWLHVVDTETSGLNPQKSSLLQLYASNLPPYRNAVSSLSFTPYHTSTLVKPGAGYTDSTGRFVNYVYTKFATQGEDPSVTTPYKVSKSIKTPLLNEEEQAHQFFSSAQESLAANRRFVFAGWNPQFDVNFLQNVSERYSSLEKYRGFFKQPGVKIASLENPFLKLSSIYGQANPDFASKYFRMGPSTPITHSTGPGMLATTPEHMRYVPGWAAENVVSAIGKSRLLEGTGLESSLFQQHEAVSDVFLEQSIYNRSRLALKDIREGGSVEGALHASGLTSANNTAEDFFKKVYGSRWAQQVERDSVAGAKMVVSRKPSIGLSGIALLVATAAAVSVALATSKRRTRQTQITGLSDTGVAAEERHRRTNFGSGWTGDNQKPFLRAGGMAAGVAGILGIHKYLLTNRTNYAQWLYNTFKQAEELSPGHILKTLSLSQWMSSYQAYTKLPTGELGLLLEHKGLVQGHVLTPTGEQVQRLLGLDPREFTEGMRFVRTRANSPYLELAGRPGYKLRFAQRGRLTGSSYRYGAPLENELATRTFAGGFGESLAERFKLIKSRQQLRAPSGGATVGIGSEAVQFQPLLGEQPGRRLGNILSKAERIGFEAAERPLRMFSKFALGLNPGTYNKLFHVPFYGEGGLLNKLVTHRVLPIYAGVTLLRYLNYKLGNKPGEIIAGAPLQANVIRAEITDRVPGFRSTTDFYKNVVPGPQYGPLALPLAGAVAGALWHYGKILKGAAFESMAARRAALHSVAGIVPKALGGAGLGLATKIGVLAMLPFLPGMLGSRRSAEELRRTYSGEQDVPIRSGRWWDTGTTPWQGGRIKYYRPHWYSLMRNKANMVATYGSQDAYWEHHPLIHPANYIQDPYWLEKAHYQDRPYPTTSPAFSNVPLIGSLLAATVGKLVKPVVSMHEGEWDPTDYVLYNRRLEPRGPIVESPLERDVLQRLSEKGYAVTAQYPVEGRRLDFVFSGTKVALEPEGYSYHHTKYQKRQDAKRRQELEKQGWKIINIASRPFFSDPDEAMQDVFSQLHELGIKPTFVGNRDIHSGLQGLAPSIPREEYNLKDVITRQAEAFAEFTGLPGFIAKSIYRKTGSPFTPGKDVIFQGSRQLTNASRSYYERELGAGLGPNPDFGEAPFGYTEPLRRFIQPERLQAQANEIPNTMPNWLPGANYMINFRVGDPYTKIAEGTVRLPGPGYEALHPEVAGLDPSEYPDIVKYKILADIAPWSTQYMSYRTRIRSQAENNTEVAIQYAQTEEQVRKIKESTVSFDPRRFSEGTEEINGTIKRAGQSGIELAEYPGRTFSFSSLGFSAADLSAVTLGQYNELSRSEIARDVDKRRSMLHGYITDTLSEGTSVRLIVPTGTEAHATEARAVVFVNNLNINKELIDRGLALSRTDLGGSESQAMYGFLGKTLGRYAEAVSFQGDQSIFNPLRYIPTPYHTKLWQERTPLEQYLSQEVYGSRTRRWEHPIQDIVMPWVRGAIRRTTGEVRVPTAVQHRRDMDTLVDELSYLRGMMQAIGNPTNAGRYTSQTKRTNIGADVFGSPSFLANTLPRRDKLYLQSFLNENDSDKRQQILISASPELARVLTAQWVKRDADIAKASGADVPSLGEGGVLYTEEGLNEYKEAKTDLSYGDFMRSKEIAEFFNRTGYNIPGPESELWSQNIDYEDVKLKIIQNEGYDMHDFSIYEDRANMLWRKPYVDGAVRELTSGGERTTERIRQTVEKIISEAHDHNSSVITSTQVSRSPGSNITINVDTGDEEAILTDIRRNRDQYEA